MPLGIPLPLRGIVDEAHHVPRRHCGARGDSNVSSRRPRPCSSREEVNRTREGSIWGCDIVDCNCSAHAMILVSRSDSRSRCKVCTPHLIVFVADRPTLTDIS